MTDLNTAPDPAADPTPTRTPVVADQPSPANDPSAGQAISLVGVPMQDGAGHKGGIMGPDALRTAGIAERLRQIGHDVIDLGDVQPDAVSGIEISGNARHADALAGGSRALSRSAVEVMAGGRLPVFLGGDHALSMGTVNGVARHWAETGRELFVLWLDAHADFNTPATSPSGNMHGMPLALLCGGPGMEAVFGDEPTVTVDPTNVFMLGIRSVDAGERALVAERGVTVYDMRRVDEFGVSACMRELIETVEARDGVLHVSLDLDFLDPSIAPGVGTTVPGGATYREAHLIMEMLNDSGLVGSLDVVELNPFLDDRGRSAVVLSELVASLFGQTVLDRPARLKPWRS